MSGILHCITERIENGEPPIRAWREQLAMPITKLAKRSGIENEQVTPEEAELARIAAALGSGSADMLRVSRGAEDSAPNVTDDEIPW